MKTTLARLCLAILICGIWSLAPQAGWSQETTSEKSDDKSATTLTTDADKSELSLEEIFKGQTPSTLEQLQAMQDHFQELVAKVRPATVGVAVGGAQGSGVIVSRDGYVLTAAHVISRPNVSATIILPDSTELKAKTLGLHHTLDYGLVKITEKGNWPYLDMGESDSLERGQWVMAIGHPGGYDKDRTPVIRVGRVQSNSSRSIRTDCTLVGGDSGGPLVDMEGDVIGIHSRIGGTLTQNLHVPIDAYMEGWDDLVSAKVKGRTTPYLGFRLKSETMEVESVTPGGPAEKGGVKVGDEILSFDDKEVDSQTALWALLLRKTAGNKVTLKVKRGDKEIDLEVELGARGR